MDFLGLGWLATPTLLAVLLVILAYVYTTWTYSFWKNRGIKGPKPYPLVGTFYGFMTQDGLTFEIGNVKKYGKVFGEYIGRNPHLMIADPVMLREILVKSSSNFVDRAQDNVGVLKDEYGSRKMLTVLRGEEWKRVRNTLTPAFTASRFKTMVSRVNICADILMDNFRAKEGQDIDVKDSTDAFTFDVIARVGFGVELDSQKDPDSPFVKHARAMFGFGDTWGQKLRIMSFLIPGCYRLMKFFNPKLSVFPGNTSYFFFNLIEKVYQQRTQDKKTQCQDMIQLMLNAHNLEQGEEDDELQTTESKTKQNSAKALSKEELMGQSLILLIAGFETTSNTLCFLMYNLACHPDIQEKAREEVDSVLQDKAEVSYEMSHQFPYLEMCICESLRMYPPASRTNRHCIHDITICGVDIPAGVAVNASIAYLHYNEDVWPEPTKFIPERFTPEEKAKRDSFNYMPFGMGPRNCLGMRLAQTELRMTIAKILQRFIITTSDKTQIPLQLRPGGLLKPKDQLLLRLEPRR